jgi:2-methylcitrate dehydratase PrpD
MAGTVTTSSNAPITVTGTLVEQAADYWATARYEDVTPEAVRLAKRFLLDTLAAGIAGSHTQVVETAIAMGAQR